ncbi:MAG: MOSC domain-containing protein [Nocardioides sp.]
MAQVHSVNVGMPVEVPWAGIGRTSIAKGSVAGPVEVHALGVAGDQVSDTRHHGGITKAVYVFAREDLDWWASQLNQPVTDGQFGENLTTTGIDVNEALIGERWRIGTVLLELAEARIPCNDFKNWMRQSGYDAAAWVKRFTRVGRPGPYLKVLQPGVLQAGDEIVVEHRPSHDVTVSRYFLANTTNKSALPAVEAALR